MRVEVTWEDVRTGERFRVRGSDVARPHPTRGPLALALRRASGMAHCAAFPEWVRCAPAYVDPNGPGPMPRRIPVPTAVTDWILDGENEPIAFDLPEE